jgi:hypothetical protein
MVGAGGLRIINSLRCLDVEFGEKIVRTGSENGTYPR